MTLRGRLHICGVEELGGYRFSGITHMISITNPSAPARDLPWFTGERLMLQFGDVVSEADALLCRTTAALPDDIDRIIMFTRQAWALDNSILLVQCDYGASRSPAVAYVAAADYAGVGCEADILSFILDIRPDAVPNNLIIALGDEYLKRGGELLRAAKSLNQSLDEEIAACMMTING